ncbi:hypothetical protein [Sporosarcina trichiuri]|uniref:hypothetical protein n=1 Tax=Sporosarcina trichiuri TaxID=3056445 RepID=UPI0025B4CF8B|nr:hypothetical protein [Sporosarcina sp. 0.2-SM1T-5]WJY26282.1 hypothetical protein QWT68_09300 [Sporosarcina sp. 0.2-SM1T-5]
MKTYIIAILLFIGGAVLSKDGQDLAYWMNEWLPAVEAVYYLIGISLLSVLLFISSVLIIWRTASYEHRTSFIYFFMLSATVLGGGLITCWTLLVLAFWLS